MWWWSQQRLPPTWGNWSEKKKTDDDDTNRGLSWRWSTIIIVPDSFSGVLWMSVRLKDACRRVSFRIWYRPDLLIQLNSNFIDNLLTSIDLCVFLMFLCWTATATGRTKRQSDEPKKEESFEKELCKDKDAGEWFRLVAGEGDNCRDVIQCTSSVSAKLIIIGGCLEWIEPALGAFKCLMMDCLDRIMNVHTNGGRPF